MEYQKTIGFSILLTKYSSGDQIKTLGWAGLVAHMGERKDACSILVGNNLNDGAHWEDSGTDGRIILKWIFEKWDRSMDWIDLAQDV
jgi:hypothetical protein